MAQAKKRAPIQAPPRLEQAAPFRVALKRAREAKGMSQSDLARKVWGEIDDPRSTGMKVARNRSRVSAYESGASMPSTEILERLAAVLDVTPEQLAPEMALRVAEKKGNKAIELSMVEGKPDQVHLVLNTLCSLATSAEIIRLLTKDPNAVAYPS